jgi:putative ABC transport system substrate-binding protein
MGPSAARCSRRRFLQAGAVVAGFGLLSGCGLSRPPSVAPGRAAHIGMLTRGAIGGSLELQGFLEALQQRGWDQQGNLTISYRFPRSVEAQASEAAELVGLPVDLVVVTGNELAQAARGASSSIPIVMAVSTDPASAGLIASLAHPGGNVTGLASLGEQLGPKRLEFLKEALPRLARLAVIWNPNYSERGAEASALQAAGRALRLQVEILQHRNQLQLRQALETVRGWPDAAAVILDEPIGPGLALAVETEVRSVPVATIGVYGAFARAGGLMAYGPSLPESFRRAAAYVDKILRGARPADLPVEQPDRFDLVVNLQTAQALGIAIPAQVLQQATEVVQQPPASAERPEA